MFTGIVAELGEVARVDHHGDAARLTIRGSTEGVALGESIAVNGVCLTVTGILGVDRNVREAAVAMGMTDRQILFQVELPLAMSVILTVTGILDGTFSADVMGETLSRSGLGALTPGDPVNLERSVRLADRMGGHLVQGHVDATATIISRTPAEHWDQVRITLPDAIARYVVEKGSIAVDGISLTVSALTPPGAAGGWFEVCLIPETLKRTTLGTRQPGEVVNLEVDVIAKYVERMLIVPEGDK